MVKRNPDLLEAEWGVSEQNRKLKSYRLNPRAVRICTCPA